VRRIYIYTGNHGHSVGISDIVTMIRNGARDCGYDAVVSHEPVSGEWNILIENFGDERYRNFIRSRWTPGTRYIIVCSELISSGGFNLGLGANDAHYGNRTYWDTRYRGFLDIASLSEELWVLHEAVIADYQKAFPDKHISFLRHGWVSGMSQVQHRREQDKDIDFFFSGGLTPSRMEILQRLEKSYRIAVLPQSGADYLRNDVLARSKICLAMPLTPLNSLPSISRLHYHIVNRNFVVQQAYAENCILDQYVLNAPASEYIDWARGALDIHNRRELAEASYSRFQAEMPLSKWLRPMLDPTHTEAGAPAPRSTYFRVSPVLTSTHH
jgi:hypothetical protein